MKAAIRNGADVSIVLSGHSDVLGDEWAAKANVAKLLKWRFGKPKVFFTSGSHCHAKVLTIDGLWSCVGSFNVDRWGCFFDMLNVDTHPIRFLKN